MVSPTPLLPVPTNLVFPTDEGALWRLAYVYLGHADICALYYAIEGARRGFESLTFMVGTIYYQGEIVPKDDVTALCFMRDAAKHGNVHTNYLCAMMCLVPAKGIAQDLAGARHHLQIPLAANYLDSGELLALLEQFEKTPYWYLLRASRARCKT